jgi:hypothetical protein
MARKLNDMLASRSAKSRTRIEKAADKMLMEVLRKK